MDTSQVTIASSSICKECNDPPQVSVVPLEVRDLPRCTKPWEDIELPVDMLLLTVKDCEFLSCISYLKGYHKSYLRDLGFVYFGEVGENECMKVAVMACFVGSAGPGASFLTVRHAVTVLSPKCVFYVGFCSGLNYNQVKLGDVVISGKFLTERGRDDRKCKIPKCPITIPLSSRTATIIKRAADGWLPPLIDREELPVKVHTGGIFLSGTKELYNVEQGEELVKRFPEAVAIDTDSEGLFAAALDLKMEWIVIKGISDFPDGRKLNKGAWRMFASVMAASLTFHILSDGMVFREWPHYGEMSDTQTSGASTVDSGSSNNKKPPEIVYSELPATKLLKKRDLPRHQDSIPWDRVDLPVDVMLLTVKDCEFLSCVSYLNPGFYKSYHENLGYVYFGKIGEEGNTMKIAIQSCEMGSDDAVVVKNAAVALKPKVVFRVGFCGGLKENLKLGDVVVSSKLRTYSSVKVTESAVEDRNVAVPLNTHLSKLLLHAGAGWKPPLENEVEVDVITNGVLLSCPEVVDNKDRRAELIRQFPDATAIEMEGQGLFKAARDLKMEWVVIKGVSDFADGRKSDTNAWRSFASVMAASVTAHILSDPNAFMNLAHYGAILSTEESKRKAAEVGDQAAKRRKETGDN